MRPTASRDELLALYAAEALDPGEAARVEAWLQADPALEARVRALAAGDLDLPPRPAWRLPPPGIGMAVDAGAPPALGPRAVRVGDTVHLDLPSQAQPETLQVVVLRRASDGWQVLAPAAHGEGLPLVRLPRGPGGGHRLALVAPGPPGLQRLAVVLAPLDLAVDWSLPEDRRWEPLLEVLRARRAPAGAVELLVG